MQSMTRGAFYELNVVAAIASVRLFDVLALAVPVRT